MNERVFRPKGAKRRIENGKKKVTGRPRQEVNKDRRIRIRIRIATRGFDGVRLAAWMEDCDLKIFTGESDGYL